MKKCFIFLLFFSYQSVHASLTENIKDSSVILTELLDEMLDYTVIIDKRLKKNSNWNPSALLEESCNFLYLESTIVAIYISQSLTRAVASSPSVMSLDVPGNYSGKKSKRLQKIIESLKNIAYKFEKSTGNSSLGNQEMCKSFTLNDLNKMISILKNNKKLLLALDK